MPPRQILLLFIRAPRPGTVKTRLAADIGPERALLIYQAMARCTVDLTQKAPDDESVDASGWRQVLWVHPPDGLDEVGAWLGEEYERHPQTASTLGDNLALAFEQAFAVGAERVVVLGTDCPEVTAAVVAEAFNALRTAPVALGPATDGGYYLIGMTRLIPELFTDIPWGTSGVFDATVQRLRAHDIPVHALAPLSDIDTLDDVRRFLARQTSGALRALASRMNQLIVGDTRE